MSEKNKALAKRVIEEIFNGGNINNLEELVARDILIHDTDKELSGLDQLRQGIANLHAAFPDLHYTIEDLLADDDKVIVRCKGPERTTVHFEAYLQLVKRWFMQ